MFLTIKFKKNVHTLSIYFYYFVDLNTTKYIKINRSTINGLLNFLNYFLHLFNQSVIRSSVVLGYLFCSVYFKMWTLTHSLSLFLSSFFQMFLCLLNNHSYTAQSFQMIYLLMDNRSSVLVSPHISLSLSLIQ